MSPVEKKKAHSKKERAAASQDSCEGYIVGG